MCALRAHVMHHVQEELTSLQAMLEERDSALAVASGTVEALRAQGKQQVRGGAMGGL